MFLWTRERGTSKLLQEDSQYSSPAPTVRPAYVPSVQRPLPRSHSQPVPPSDEWVQIPRSASRPDM
ncbi:hypothetical protein FISHEDRAFT_73045 [Fistulina hepatica ATCC 64428]|uniref:Uncharacterized protein n=1 Tax=Fistulina hepatica ATCC 64428 TaxID=1128425 RepID=A0A0D7AGK2_9AGAR|nr:hypothetical protein FISHEDRAFT_73045 [Fistulina hepatica ATCC 64428]